MNQQHSKPRSRFFMPEGKKAARRAWMLPACGGLTALSLISGAVFAHAGANPYKQLQTDIAGITALQTSLENFGEIKTADQLAAFKDLVDEYMGLVVATEADAAAYQTVLNEAAQKDPNQPTPKNATEPDFSNFLAAAVAYQDAVARWIAENTAIIMDNEAQNAQYVALAQAADAVGGAASLLNNAKAQLENAIANLNGAVSQSKTYDWVGKDGKAISYQDYVATFIPAVEDALSAYQGAAANYTDAAGQYRTEFKAAEAYAKANGLALIAEPLSDENWHNNYFTETYQSVLAAIDKARQATISTNGILVSHYLAASEAFDAYNEALQQENEAKEYLAKVVATFPMDSSTDPAKLANATADLNTWISAYLPAFTALQQKTTESLSLRQAYRQALMAYLEAGANNDFFSENNAANLNNLTDDENYNSLLYLNSLQVTGNLTTAPSLNIVPGDETTPAMVAGTGSVIDAVNIYLANLKETTLFNAAASAWDKLDKMALTADQALHNSLDNLLAEQGIMDFRADLREVMERLSDTSQNTVQNRQNPDFNENQLTSGDVEFLLYELVPGLQEIADHLSDQSRWVEPSAADIAKQFEIYKQAGRAYNEYAKSQTADGEIYVEVFQHTAKDDNGYSGLYAPLQALDNEYRQMGQPSLSCPLQTNTKGAKTWCRSATNIETLTRNTLAGWVDVFYDYVANNVGIDTTELYQKYFDYGITPEDWQQYLDMLEAAFPDSPSNPSTPNAAPAAAKSQMRSQAPVAKPVFTMAAFIITPIADNDQQLSILSEDLWHDTQVIYGTSYPHYEFNFPTYVALTAPLAQSDKAGFEPPKYFEIELKPLEGPARPEIGAKVKAIGRAKVWSELAPVPPLPKVPHPPVVVSVGLNATRAPLARTGVNVMVLVWTLTAGAAGSTIFAYRTELSGISRRWRRGRSVR